jgi:hypothetical protein
MRRTLVALPVALLAIAATFTPDASAQETKTARGTVAAVAAKSVTVTVEGAAMTFAVDEKTTIEATGAGTKARQAEAAGKPGPKLGELVKVGQAVEVSYRAMGGTNQATRIRRVSSVGSSPSASTSATGKVTAISPTSLTISGASGGGATFTATYTIDPATRVIGKGAGTAAAARGGKVVATDLIKSGDTVNVSYSKTGDTLHASEIRVTVKAATK